MIAAHIDRNGNKQVEVKGQTFTVFSSWMMRATYAEDANGVVKALSESGYVSNERTVKKRIAAAFEV